MSDLEWMDQVFVLAKRVLVQAMPGPWQSLGSAVITAAALLALFPALFAVVTWLERKGLARMQNRYGPNRVGPCGLLQPLADGLKTLTKEDVVPREADRIVHGLAPLVLVVPVFLALAVVPVGRNMVALDLDAGLLYFFAVGASSEVAVFMAGWASRNKYSLLGAMRAIAQMISYELPLILSAIVVVMAAGSLSLVRIVEAQAGFHGLLPAWHVFTPWGLAGFLLFLVAAIAESNRSPFDLPEGESELVAGYFTEYSGFKFALFFLGEYLGMFAVSGVGISLFLGGWQAPLPFLTWVPSWVWFPAKLLGMIAFFIWVRGTMPRLRMDQLLNLAWKFMIPLAVINLGVAMLWQVTRSWEGGWSGVGRWCLGFVLLAVPYVALGRALMARRGRGPRVYRYAH
jgi:NADH-quinone oxidoreductase subunit H